MRNRRQVSDDLTAQSHSETTKQFISCVVTGFFLGFSHQIVTRSAQLRGKMITFIGHHPTQGEKRSYTTNPRLRLAQRPFILITELYTVCVVLKAVLCHLIGFQIAAQILPRPRLQ